MNGKKKFNFRISKKKLSNDAVLYYARNDQNSNRCIILYIFQINLINFNDNLEVNDSRWKRAVSSICLFFFIFNSPKLRTHPCLFFCGNYAFCEL